MAETSRDFFEALESAEDGERRALPETLSSLRFDARGLLPVVTQCADSGRVLMLAWMNMDALRATMRDGLMTYFSRRRGTLWRKGETSGNVQRLVSLSADCDGDSLLAVVHQTGSACHTGRPACFYLRLSSDDAEVAAPAFPPEKKKYSP